MIYYILAAALAVPGAAFLFMPGRPYLGLLLLFLAALVLLLRWKKKLTILLFSVFVVLFGALEIPIASAASEDAPKSLDYILVLGCAVYGETPSLPLQERINAAYGYLAENPNTRAILSGGQGNGEDISEAECMYRRLTAMGIAPDRLFLEDQSTTTRENLLYSYEIIEALEAENKSPDEESYNTSAVSTGAKSPSVGIVSNEFHLFRIRYLAKMQGRQVYTIAAPTTLLTVRLNYFIREAPAMLKALFIH